MPAETMELFIAAVGGAGSGGVAAYYAAREAIKVELARLDERVKALRDTVDSDHAKLDQLERAIYSRGKS